MDLWIQIVGLNLSFFTAVLIPSMLFFWRRFKEIDEQIMLLKRMIEDLHLSSNQADLELEKNWVHFYHNEIMRFWERLQVKPDLIPSEEHYKSVFENYERYKELGGMKNGYVGAIMNSIRELHKQQYGPNNWPPVLHAINYPDDKNK